LNFPSVSAFAIDGNHHQMTHFATCKQAMLGLYTPLAVRDLYVFVLERH
jgi:hypothetical protein